LNAAKHERDQLQREKVQREAKLAKLKMELEVEWKTRNETEHFCTKAIDIHSPLVFYSLISYFNRSISCFV
jgi:hypothetical protein